MKNFYLGAHDYRVLHALHDDCWSTAGQVAQTLYGYLNLRRDSQLVRQNLLRLLEYGLVAKDEGEKPSIWKRTIAGTEALKQWRG